MDNPIEPIRTLANRLRQTTENMGLELVGFSVVPHMDDGGGPDMFQAVFAMKPECLLTPEERKANKEQSLVDDEFERLMSGVEQSIEVDKESEKIEEARKGTADLLKDFLDGE